MNTRENSNQLKTTAKQHLHQGRYSSALKSLEEMLLFDNCDSSTIHSDIALVHRVLGNTTKYKQHLRKSISCKTISAVASTNYGVFLSEQGNHEEARSYFEYSNQINPKAKLPLINLAMLEMSIGNLDEAKNILSNIKTPVGAEEAELAAALDLNMQVSERDIQESIAHLLAEYKQANSADICITISHKLKQLGMPDEALLYARQAIAAEPNRAGLFVSLASLLVDNGRAIEAIEALIYTLSIDPDNLNILIALGDAYFGLGDYASALDAYKEVQDADEINTRVLNCIGCCYVKLKLEFSAIRVLEKAMRLNPDNLDIPCNLAGAYRNTGKHEDAINLCTDILNRDSSNELAFYQLMFTYSVLGRRFIIPSLEASRSYWSQANLNTSMQKDLISRASLGIEKSISKQGKIRVGIISAEVGHHVVSMFLKPFLVHYNRDEFHVCVASSRKRYDQTADELLTLPDEVISIHGMPDNQAIDYLRQQCFDIAIETSGYTDSTKISLFAKRIAPVQCHYIGYHSSLGMKEVDYFIGDEVVTPIKYKSDFKETIFQLPTPWLTISYHEELPIATSRASCQEIIFGSMNQAAKFTPITYDYWCAVLSGVPNSIIQIKNLEVQDQEMAELIYRELTSRSIEGKRIKFHGPHADWKEHMSFYNYIDISLDCTPWSGSTTTFDSLSMGTPYMAIKGDCTASLMSTSIVTGLGKDDWIASNINEYVDLARYLSKDLGKLRASKRSLQLEVLSSKLHDGAASARALENSIKQMTSRAQENKSS